MKSSSKVMISLFLVSLGILGGGYIMIETSPTQKNTDDDAWYWNLFRPKVNYVQYNISESCQSAHGGSKFQPKFECSVKTNDLLNTPLIENYTAPVKYSSHKCTKEGHCMYSNVCIQKKDVFYYHGLTQEIGDYGFYRYRGLPSWPKTFSFWYNLKPVQLSLFERKEERWVSGTSLFYDQSFDHMCHVGHSQEFSNKLTELRERFPGPINRILYASDREVYRLAPFAYKMCYVACNQLRIGFEHEQWVYPTIYWLEMPVFGDPDPYQVSFNWTNEPLCFEKLLVPSNQNQHFTSQSAADSHRSAGLRMCGIKERDWWRPEMSEKQTPYIKQKPKKVLFLTRAADRHIINSKEICTHLQSLGFETYTEIEDQEFCSLMATVHMADIIITVDGSHNFILNFARPGSSVILVHPYHISIPDWKTMLYQSRLRTLELHVLNKSHSIPHHQFKRCNTKLDPLNSSLKDCGTDICCRIALTSRDSYIPLEVFMMYFDGSIKLFDDTYGYYGCEKPLPWPVEDMSRTQDPESLNDITGWYQFGLEHNFDVCEPEYPNCICCKDKECLQATRHYKRPF